MDKKLNQQNAVEIPLENPSLKANLSSSWTYLTNHFHVLLVLYLEPTSRIRDMAIKVGITERAVQKILAELIESGVITIEKNGRRNRYTIDQTVHLKHPLESKHNVGTLLQILA
jgi:predicted transcriptional regulator